MLAVCAREYLKSKEKLKKLEGEVEELKAQQEEEENQAAEAAELTESDEHKMLITVEKVKDKTGALMGGRASNERKWRDAQLAYSNILKVCAHGVLYGNALVSFLKSIVRAFMPGSCDQSVLPTVAQSRSFEQGPLGA